MMKKRGWDWLSRRTETVDGPWRTAGTHGVNNNDEIRTSPYFYQCRAFTASFYDADVTTVQGSQAAGDDASSCIITGIVVTNADN
jgi:hypothetical protein